MSFSVNKISCTSLRPSFSAHYHQNWDECRRTSNIKFHIQKVLPFSWIHHNNHRFALNSINGGDTTSHGLSDHQSYSAELEGSMERKDDQQHRPLSTTKFYFAPAPGKMGYLAAVSRFLKVMAMVWAGSQVTKLLRAAGALALAPLVDRGLSWFTVRYKFESRGKAFFTIVALCLSLAIIVFLAVTLLWA
ncbi:uncharacterized protein LOC104907419 isoform X2 [Beta vulgaris subsp. vulgaris]|uniref:uncharacterized protein LOC104907419 isoform X2 n=1 Tax=Beta vulgaris subsp. vulgaris TaxID=3555 RepID=UPI002036C8DB|nr:uncharacterized protein LOC104907419 isoform X2 [Beta vulgaris subsp. vulgaris]